MNPIKNTYKLCYLLWLANLTGLQGANFYANSNIAAMQSMLDNNFIGYGQVHWLYAQSNLTDEEVLSFCKQASVANHSKIFADLETIDLDDQKHLTVKSIEAIANCGAFKAVHNLRLCKTKMKPDEVFKSLQLLAASKTIASDMDSMAISKTHGRPCSVLWVVLDKSMHERLLDKGYGKELETIIQKDFTITYKSGSREKAEGIKWVLIENDEL